MCSVHMFIDNIKIFQSECKRVFDSQITLFQYRFKKVILTFFCSAISNIRFVLQK